MSFIPDTKQVAVAKAAADWCECVQKAVEPMVLREFMQFTAVDDKTFERRVSHAPQLFDGRPDPHGEIAKNLALLAEFILDPLGRDFGSAIGIFLSIGIRSVTQSVALAWFAAIRTSLTVVAGQPMCNIATIDESMLPRGRPDADVAFAASLRETGGDSVTVSEARQILSTLRSGMAVGRRFPEEAEWLLEVNDIIIVR